MLLNILAAEGDQGGPGGWPIFVGAVIMIVVFYAVLFSGPRDKKRQEMQKSVKKGDRIMTVGGILGSVVAANENEVTLKVDESANVKITVIRRAVQKILAE
jgi:preprotein translocase subunit YajC